MPKRKSRATAEDLDDNDDDSSNTVEQKRRKRAPAVVADDDDDNDDTAAAADEAEDNEIATFVKSIAERKAVNPPAITAHDQYETYRHDYTHKYDIYQKLNRSLSRISYTFRKLGEEYTKNVKKKLAHQATKVRIVTQFKAQEKMVESMRAAVKVLHIELHHISSRIKEYGKQQRPNAD